MEIKTGVILSLFLVIFVDDVVFGEGGCMYEVYGAVVAGIFTVFAVLIKFYLNGINERDIEFYELTDHPLFDRIDYMMNQIDYSLEYEDTGRYLLITDVMEKFFSVVKKELYEFADQAEDYEREQIEFNIHDIHMKVLNKIVKEYTDVDSYNSGMKDESRKTLKLFLEKFQSWHEERINFICQRSVEISNSDFYKRDAVKISVLFDVYVGILASTLEDANKTLRDLNGELDGMFYKEIEIGEE